MIRWGPGAGLALGEVVCVRWEMVGQRKLFVKKGRGKRRHSLDQQFEAAGIIPPYVDKQGHLVQAITSGVGGSPHGGRAVISGCASMKQLATQF